MAVAVLFQVQRTRATPPAPAAAAWRAAARTQGAAMNLDSRLLQQVGQVEKGDKGWVGDACSVRSAERECAV